MYRHVSGAQVKTIVKKERAEDLGMTADELLQRQLTSLRQRCRWG